jgi:pimeloyl-ACP methyl ester carboxylesterase
MSVLPPALDAERFEIVTRAGRVSAYRAWPQAGAANLPPLLLVHSVNASGSAAEVAPLFEHCRRRRAVYALDLPGFGFSERSDRVYTPRMMTDAIHALLSHMRQAHGVEVIDVLGLSLSGEFVVRAQQEAPHTVRRVALVSPTGFSGRTRRHGPTGSTLFQAWLYKLLAWSRWSDGVYRNLTRPSVIRYFLERTWGSKHIDEGLWRYDLVTTRQPGAKYAPLYFVSAGLFSRDINTLYENVACPVWVSMATRGDFTNYQGKVTVEQRPNWHFHAIEGGALPYFEDLPAFAQALDPFWV